MKFHAIILAAAIAAASSVAVQAAPLSANGIESDRAPVTLVQMKKDEKVSDKVEKAVDKTKRKVKRAWKKLVGYKFAVACPALLPVNHSTCSETGKNREDARAKCQAANPLCSVRDAN